MSEIEPPCWQCFGTGIIADLTIDRDGKPARGTEDGTECPCGELAARRMDGLKRLAKREAG